MTASTPRRTRLPFVLAAACAALVTLHAQTPHVPSPAGASAPPPAGEQTPVFRAGVEVLPLDAVVLDRDGRQVTDLTAAQAAGEVVDEQRMQTDRSLGGIRSVLKSLSGLEGTKSVILVSEGLVLDGLGGDLEDVASIAADVRASLDVLLLDVPTDDVSQSQMATTASDDRQLREGGLMMLAGMARGTLHRVVSTADTAFRRIEQALAGYYLLGVEPGATDRDGKRHRIEVTLARRGLTVQARRAFLSPEGPPAATPADALKRTLRSPTAATALPLRLTTWTYKEPGTSRVKCIRRPRARAPNSARAST